MFHFQSRCRGTLACCHYSRLKRAAIAAQCAWRAKLACKELRMLKSAAKETGALQEAKSKLEKEVEDLTWQLQLEKRMRADIEEAKNQETIKLASALQKMQVQFQETKDQLMKELETAKELAGPATFIQDLPVIKDELVDKLSAENEKLKVSS
ncbi:UNVERIFIED_CONTAM: Myosin-14 [Sesamum radiatum]|uniref:Myosin-14 n=1 Tax=Sesamum radiatum TaxID=300843 RepID=A0AAW2QG04_SESRA